MAGIPIDQVWARIRDFCDLSWATDKDTKTGPEDPSRSAADNASRVGARRVITIPPAGFIKETLTAHSDEKHSYSYNITEFSPEVFPGKFQNYNATISLSPAPGGAAGTVASWTASFDGEAETADFVTMGLEEDVFGAGLARLETALRGSTAAITAPSSTPAIAAPAASGSA